MNPTLRKLDGTPEQIAAMQGVCEASPGFIRNLFGRPLEGSEGYLLFHAPAPNKLEKLVYGVFLDSEMIGFCHTAHSHPLWTTIWLSLILIKKSYRNQGIGSEVLNQLEQLISQAAPTSTILLAELTDKGGSGRADRFWQRHGFNDTRNIIEHKRLGLCGLSNHCRSKQTLSRSNWPGTIT